MARAAPTTRGRRCVPPGARRDRQADLRQAEPGTFRGDPHVAAQRELQTAAERVALDGGDGRHRQLGKPAGDAGLELVSGAAGRASLGLELADVRPGGERALAAPADDDGADVAGRRRGERPERRRQLLERALA